LPESESGSQLSPSPPPKSSSSDTVVDSSAQVSGSPPSVKWMS
jgi:hypothetical protein